MLDCIAVDNEAVQVPIRSTLVSFISLFGSSFALRVLRGRAYRAVYNTAT
jgi:hypothetical protein